MFPGFNFVYFALPLFHSAKKIFGRNHTWTPYLCKWYNDGEKYYHHFNIKSPYKEVFK